MIDGANLAATAKHTPELLDPDVVRAAGRQLELFASLLSGLESVDVDRYRGTTTFTFTIDTVTADDVMYHRYCD